MFQAFYKETQHVETCRVEHNYCGCFLEYTNFKNDLIGHDDKNCEACRGKYKSCDCFLEYTNFKDDLIEYKSLYCKIF